MRNADDSDDLDVLAARCGGPRAEAAMIRIIERHTPMMKRIVRRLRIEPQDEADAMQSAALGLIRAVRRYEAGRGAQLPTYAYHYIRGQVYVDFYGAPGECQRPRHPERLPSDLDDDSSSDIPVDARDGPEDLVVARQLAAVISARLTKFERCVFAQLCSGTYSQAAVSRRLAVHPKRVSRAISRLRILTTEVMITPPAA